jgi:hypothetical protein
MCRQCAELQRRIQALEAMNKTLRGLNTRMNRKNMLLSVENNNLRASIGVQMRPVGQGYLVEWEQRKEGGL